MGRNHGNTRRLGVVAIRGAALLALVGLSLQLSGPSRGSPGIAPVMTSKSIPPATVALIDPESGTSSGGGSTDVNVAVGDIVLFRMTIASIPENSLTAIQSYLTDYIPANTEVVGLRIIDEDGLTVLPNLPGLAPNDCGENCNFGAATDNLFRTGTNNKAVDDGSIAQIYGDTGLFWSVDPLLVRQPSNGFIVMENGWTLGTGNNLEPAFADSLAPLLGKIPGPYYSHNTWDLLQAYAFGISQAGDKTAGKGNTPRFYGSPVAGPDTYYNYTVTYGDVASANTCADKTNPHNYCAVTYGGSAGQYACDLVADRCKEIAFDDVAGPWSRIVYPGSVRTGFSNVPTTKGGTPTRSVVSVDTGFDVSPLRPLISKVSPAQACVVRSDCNTACGGAWRCQCVDEGGGNKYCYKNATATRWAIGEARVGEPVTVEIALRVLATPLDPIQGKDVNCAEVMGAEIAGYAAGTGTNNPWPFFVPMPSCVYLNLLFDLTVDKLMATQGNPLQYTLKGKNLSTAQQNGAVARIIYPGNAAFVSASGIKEGTIPLGFTPDTCGTKACLVFDLGNLAAGDEYTITANFTVSGIGNPAVTMFANYTSAELPEPGFTTQAVTASKTAGSPKLTLKYTSPEFVPTTGGQARLDGTLANVGTGSMGGVALRVFLPTGFTMASASIGGMALTCGAPAGGYASCTGVPTLAPGDSRAVVLNVNVPNGTAIGLYPVDLAVLVTIGGQFKDIERFLRSGVVIPVGQERANAPLIDCPIDRNQTSIHGTSDEIGGRVRVFFNGVERGTGTYTVTVQNDGTWTLPAAEWQDEFGNLYGGLEVRANVDGAGTNLSPLSTACFVGVTPTCSDGRDNDGDGLVDFPADPGCSSPLDGSEEDVGATQCSDGFDNDGDGLVDYPYDPGCSSTTDATELNGDVCSDLQDNDGDGLIDALDPGCTMTGNRTELDLARCQDGIDNDGDGKIDFPADPGCHSAFDDDETDFFFSDNPIKARLLIAFDTSGSMNWNTCHPVFTGGDGSDECPGDDVSCSTESGCPGPGCADGLPNDSRMSKVKSGLSDAVAAYGSVDWGLMRFHQRPMEFGCPSANASLQSGGWQGAGAAPCGGGFAAGDLLVGFGPENVTDILDWMDGSTNYGTPGHTIPPPGFDKELRGSGTTPLGGILLSAQDYITDTQNLDSKSACRPYRVILVTDGGETCAGDPAGVAYDLFHLFDVKVHVIGFATDDVSIIANLNGIAASGGTSTAVFADNAVGLSSAIAQIITESILVERCNGIDDNCNGLIDEDFPDKGAVCNNGLKGVCFTTGHRQCRVDELGTECVLDSVPATPSTEICDGLDNDCDGDVDEGNACVLEYCNGVDDYGDGFVKADGSEDPRVGQPCGSSVGECTIGVTICVAGNIVCNGQQPVPEICDALDQDCDGINNNGIAPRACEIAVAGVGTCTGLEICDSTGAWVNCSAQTPQVEVCDGYDNNCNGQTDENLGQTTCGTGICLKTVDNCVLGVPQFCDPYEGAIAEICNGLDDDCDGSIDDGLGNTTCGVGACLHTVPNCVGGVTQICDPFEGVSSEVCDNVDNDCDGLKDEDAAGNPLSQSCYTGPAGTAGRGVCTTGNQVCTTGNWGVCAGQVTPTTEICDGLDNDCDLQTDEGLGTTTCGLGACLHTINNCESGIPQVCNPMQGSTAETCDGTDNDCDGIVDGLTRECYSAGSGNGCTLDATGTAWTCQGVCATGVDECAIGAGHWGGCTGDRGPGVETCNGLDDDCDGSIDEDAAGDPLTASCYPAGYGAGRGCTSPGVCLGLCHEGTRTCTNGSFGACVDAVVPATEICDGVDNDCDGLVDEGADGLPMKRNCNNGACTGVETCSGGVWTGCTAPTPATETCNNTDDNCDGQIDENVTQTCYSGASGTVGVGACRAGLQTCVAGVYGACVGEVVPQVEVCDGVDNDCDGLTDEDAAGQPLTQVCYTGPAGTPGHGVCQEGQRICQGGAWSACQGEVVPTTEQCDGADNDCDDQVDEGFGTTTCGLGACAHTVVNCLGGVTQTCNPLQGAVAETCDGTDNDCDGIIDGLSRECYDAGSGNGCTLDATGTAWTCLGVCSTGVDECAVGGTGTWSGCVGDVGPSLETCNGLDDDCDGTIDEDASGGPITAICYPPGYGPGRGCTAPGVCPGQCQEGTRTCTNGSLGACLGAVTPGVEVCDGVDNDCDGLTDEDAAGNPMTRACNNGACTGVETCSGGAWTGCTAPTPGTEVCDNADNNCDGQIDENVTQSCYSGPAGTLGTGACRGGLQTCVAGVYGACVGEVVPQVEVCDGLDNDCNGQVDEDASGNPLTQVCYTGPPGSQGHGACKEGLRVCQNGAWTACLGEVVPTTEVCDGTDNDCDDVADEGFGTTTCGLGECAHTVQDCFNGSPLVCNPLEGAAPELCDGKDNDCDGVADGLTRTCYEFGAGCTYDATAMTWACLGVCGTGTQQCPVGSAAWGDCLGDRGPGVETCNGFDDDCDGATDEDAAGNPLTAVCYPAGYGANTGCTQPGQCRGACHEGVRTCTGGAFGVCTGAVTPATEICDNVDNDCDGLIDENLTRSCQNSNAAGTCNGTQTCGSGSWSTCTAAVPAVETCDGIDNDCDGSIDENLTRSCYTGAAGTQGVGTCRAGTETCTAAAWGTCVGQVVPQAETCDGRDNDCDGVVDEGPDGQPLSQACYTGPAGTAGVGECRMGVRTCVNGNWTSCTGEQTPRTETCDGRDNDCDGQTDEGLGTTTCGLGACQHTVNNCEGGSPVVCDPNQGASVEVCDGVDNDCDGTVDGLARTCYPGGAAGCAETPAGSGNWTCQGSCAVGIDVCAQGSGGTWSGCQYAVVPSQEQCDNVDNDCDGQVDEDDQGGPLSQGCYSPGSVLSSGCTRDATGDWSCLGECRSGVRTCITGAWGLCVGEVTPAVERCNNRDDDCDGTVDEPEDIPGLDQPCGTALGRCTPGTLHCVDGVESCDGGTGPFPGECNSQDDDCDGEIDEADEVAAVEGQPCGNPEGACVAGETMCVGGAVICTGEVQPSPEVCDGEDNDCDGDIDNEAPCPALYHCYQAGCRRECDPSSEFPCPVGLSCVQVTLDGSLVEELCLPGGACGGVTCPEGWSCVEDECVDPCASVTCDWWEVCNGGNCIDRSCTAVGFACTGGDICVNHECVPDPCSAASCDVATEVCVPNCDSQACEPLCEPLCLCPDGQRCDGQGGCEADPCADVQCDLGYRCDPDTGGCEADPCAQAFCQVGDVCFEGECIEDPCRQIRCPPYFQCELHREGDGNGGYVPEPICRADTDYYDPGTSTQKFLLTGAGGCACQTQGEGRGAGVLFLMTALLLLWRRRRARVRKAQDGEVA
jgi:hypothetical protein